MNIPDSLKYSKEHEWLSPEGAVGITDFAQDSLGDIVFVSLPEVGKTFTAGEAVAEVESTKSVSEIYAPCGGTVASVNEELNSAPELINSDPYGKGWIFKVDGVTDDGSLMSAEDYTALTE